MKTSEVLRKAADEIRRRGWHQGANGSNFGDKPNCSVCAVGAIRATLSGGDPFDSVDFRLESALGDAVAVAASASDSLHRWNDDPERTVEEVLDAFEKAAVAAEAEGN